MWGKHCWLPPNRNSLSKNSAENNCAVAACWGRNTCIPSLPIPVSLSLSPQLDDCHPKKQSSNTSFTKLPKPKPVFLLLPVISQWQPSHREFNVLPVRRQTFNSCKHSLAGAVCCDGSLTDRPKQNVSNWPKSGRHCRLTFMRAHCYWVQQCKSRTTHTKNRCHNGPCCGCFCGFL